LIAIFITLTTPITLMLLVRAALYRDRSEDAQNVPSSMAIAEAFVIDDQPSSD
jgi:multicomponent K+:H+ antiporter subunit G